MNSSPGHRTGYVVSDLHIFSCASLYKRALPQLSQAISTHSVVVLNGDTFDFKRSIFPTSQETARQAAIWLRTMCENSPHATFHYLLGNHDCHVHWMEQINELTRTVSNLNIVHDTLLLGSALFIHGDVIDLPDGSRDLSSIRTKYAHAEPNLLSKAFANVVTHLRLNSVEYLRHRKKTLAVKILSYLKAVHPEQLSKATQIFFGHTHVPFTQYHHGRFVFHNTGSLVRGLPWLPLEFEITPSH
jgi:UDP-2,3-diacylglucosamine pyrophosphatase LpxH